MGGASSRSPPPLALCPREHGARPRLAGRASPRLERLSYGWPRTAHTRRAGIAVPPPAADTRLILQRAEPQAMRKGRSCTSRAIRHFNFLVMRLSQSFVRIEKTERGAVTSVGALTLLSTSLESILNAGRPCRGRLTPASANSKARDFFRGRWNAGWSLEEQMGGSKQLQNTLFQSQICVLKTGRPQRKGREGAGEEREASQKCTSAARR